MSLWPYKGKYCVQIRQVVGIGYKGVYEQYLLKKSYKEWLNLV